MAVAVDPKMVERYGDDLHDLVLLTMSIASSLFSKSNIGLNLRLSVTNIIELPNELGTFPTSADETGKYFCEQIFGAKN